jgi:hypothetical protein
VSVKLVVSLRLVESLLKVANTPLEVLNGEPLRAFCRTKTLLIARRIASPIGLRRFTLGVRDMP